MTIVRVNTGRFPRSYDQSIFDYLNPTISQRHDMGDVHSVMMNAINQMHILLPSGKEKDRIMRVLWSAMMWANVAITRNDDGTPRNNP